MARTVPKIGNKQKALIHVAKSSVGMSEEAYRDMLGSVGVVSSKDLDVLQFEEIMRRFEAAGFVASSSRRGAGLQNRRAQEKRPRATQGKEALMSKVGAILADTGLSWAYADGMVRKMFGVDSVRFCNQTQLWKVAAALSIYQKRRRRAAPGGMPSAEARAAKDGDASREGQQKTEESNGKKRGRRGTDEASCGEDGGAARADGPEVRRPSDS